MSRKAKTGAVTVVIAWTRAAKVWDGQPFARDLGEVPGMKDVVTALACVWIRSGTAADVEKAEAYAGVENPKRKAQGYDDDGPIRVFVYPITESDPLARAKKDVLTP